MARALFADAFLTAQRKGHPRGTAPLGLDTFCALDHLVVLTDGAGFLGMVDRTLAGMGRSRRVALSIQSYSLAPLVVAASDCLCTLPGRFLRRFAREVDLFAPPLPLPSHELMAILNAPATAEAMAELIIDGMARSVDLRPFDPGRLRSAGRVPIRRDLPQAASVTI